MAAHAKRMMIRVTPEQRTLVKMFLQGGAHIVVNEMWQDYLRLSKMSAEINRMRSEARQILMMARRAGLHIDADAAEALNIDLPERKKLGQGRPKTVQLPSLPKLLWAGVVDAVQAFLSPSRARSLLQQDDAPDVPQPSQSERRTTAARTIR